MTSASTLGDMSPGLLKVVERARREPEGRFHSLAHLIDVPALARAYRRMRKDAAVGVDGITKEQYGQELEGNLQDLHDRLTSKRYRHHPIRRVHIPKGKDETRPIGISAFEDKLVQDAVCGNPYRYTGRPHARVLEGSGETWYDYRARHYRADAGRFVQRDPGEYADDVTAYSYARNEPNNRIDPLATYSLEFPIIDPINITCDCPVQGFCTAAKEYFEKYPPMNGGCIHLVCTPDCISKRYCAKTADSGIPGLEACNVIDVCMERFDEAPDLGDLEPGQPAACAWYVQIGLPKCNLNPSGPSGQQPEGGDVLGCVLWHEGVAHAAANAAGVPSGPGQHDDFAELIKEGGECPCVSEESQ